MIYLNNLAKSFFSNKINQLIDWSIDWYSLLIEYINKNLNCKYCFSIWIQKKNFINHIWNWNPGFYFDSFKIWYWILFYNCIIVYWKKRKRCTHMLILDRIQDPLVFFLVIIEPIIAPVRRKINYCLIVPKRTNSTFVFFLFR